MFESLEPRPQMIDRRWPLIMYGTYCVIGLVFAVLGVRRHGFSQPYSLVIACAMFLFAVVCLLTTLRQATRLTSRKLALRNFILLLLLMAHSTVRL